MKKTIEQIIEEQGITISDLEEFEEIDGEIDEYDEETE